MKIPNVPADNLMRKDPISGQYDIHPAWSNFFRQLIQELQQGVSDQGYKIPQQPASTIALLDNMKAITSIVYDQDNHLFKGSVNGTFKTFTLT